MSSKSVKITATGTKNPASEGHEVLLVGGAGASGGIFEARAELVLDGWALIRDVKAGALGQLNYAFQGLHGTLEIECGANGRLAFISHPWSGIAKIEIGDFATEIDLYSAETSVVYVDFPDGKLGDVHAKMLKRLAFRSPRSSQPNIQISATPEGGRDNELVIKALGQNSPGSLSTEVIVLEVEPFGLGVRSDLWVYQGPQWQRTADIVVDKVAWFGGLKGLQGELHMDCNASGKVTFLRHEWSGLVEVSYGGTSITVDLFSPSPAVLTLKVDELDQLHLEYPDEIDNEDHPRKSLGLAGDPPRRALFQRLSEQFDTAKPVGLYVPRWHGVAASTKALFDQTLPIPEGVGDHPDNITEDDIREYAEILVDTGCRHFVISGGDLFNLAIIEEVLVRAPDVRFDQLWHSNFLQMGEPHDWNLLRHWLTALRDGTVTRIGVVKEGLVDWFGRFGLDAVFIPNVIEFDPSTIQPTTINDTVGIWLSGSSSYRKLPHAALMALKMMPNVALMGAGLDPHSMRMINDLKLPFRQISSNPLPQKQMFRRMQKTGLTLYVTVSECSPMVPLESFALGIPCLVGPSSHLFRSNDILREALVVQHPHSPAEIAEKTQAALHNQETLFSAYLKYYEEEKRMAREGVARLIA